jgi:hypothetical protein
MIGNHIIYKNKENYSSLSAFPVAGNPHLLYQADDTGELYTWTGSTYSLMKAGLANTLTLDKTIGPIVTAVDINDLTHPDLHQGNRLAVEPTANNVDITGITAPPAGVNQMLFITNESGTYKLTLQNNSGLSLAANRFNFKANISLEEYLGVILFYDHGISKWRCISINS